MFLYHYVFQYFYYLSDSLPINLLEFEHFPINLNDFFIN